MLRLFGNIPEASDWFMITVIHLDILLVINFRSFEEMPSCPLLVEILVFFMMRIVALLSIKWN